MTELTWQQSNYNICVSIPIHNVVADPWKELTVQASVDEQPHVEQSNCRVSKPSAAGAGLAIATAASRVKMAIENFILNELDNIRVLACR